MRINVSEILKFLFARKVGDLLLLWIWELPQTLLGLVILFFQFLRGRVNSIGIVENVLVVSCKKRWGAMSLGQIIVGDESLYLSVNNQLLRHEYGHSIQSNKAGPLYLVMYGLPSLWSAVFRKNRHGTSPVEKSANRLAYQFFTKKYAFLNWDHHHFPLT